MRKELDEKLCATYPLLFVDRYEDMTKTAMCWGFDCGDGWYPLINALCERLYARYNYTKSRLQHTEDGTFRYKDEAAKQWALTKLQEELEQEEKDIPIVFQVKEKFGGLHFYTHPREGCSEGTRERAQQIVFIYECISYHVCEECSIMEGVTTEGNGWIKTLCPSCRAERDKRRQKLVQEKEIFELE